MKKSSKLLLCLILGTCFITGCDSKEKDKNKDNFNPVAQDKNDDWYDTNISEDEVKKKIAMKAEKTLDGEIIVFVKNNSNSIIDDIELKCYFKDSSDNIIDIEKDGHDMVIPGSTVVSNIKTYDSYNKYVCEIDSIELGRYSKYKNHAKKIDVKTSKANGKLIIEIKNNDDVEIDEIELAYVFYKDGKLIGSKEYEIRHLDASKTDIGKLDLYEIDTYDKYEMYINQAHTFGL